MRHQPRRAQKRDSNEAALVADLIAAGYEVERGGPVDLLVWRRGWDFVMAVEVKGEKGHLTATQTDLIARRFPMVVARDAKEALKALDAVDTAGG